MTTQNFTQEPPVLKTALQGLSEIDEILNHIESIHQLLAYLETVQSVSEHEETRSHLLCYLELLTVQMRGVYLTVSIQPCT